MSKWKALPVLILIPLSIILLVMIAAPPSSLTTAAGVPRAGIFTTGAQRPTVVPAVAADQKALKERLIGYRHKGVTRGEKLPNGARDLGGALLSDEDYGVTRFSKGQKFMLWFEKIIDRDEAGVPDWEVKDVLVFDELKKNRMFLYSYSSPCTNGGAEDLDLIVMAEAEPKKRAYRILRAWRANVETEKFEEVATAAIACAYDDPR